MSDTKCAPQTALKPGLHLQLYIDAFRAGTVTRNVTDITSKALKECPRVVSGIIIHDFPKNRSMRGLPTGLVDRMKTLRHMVSLLSNELQWSASFGLDGTQDHDGTSLTAAEKGQRMAEVSLACDGCVIVADAEGKWDSDEGAADDMDEAGALAMCAAFRKHAPTSVMVDQPWPMIDQHGQNRKVVRPISEGGSFAGFPVDEFATLVSARYPQAYWANWYRTHGARAYKHVIDWMNREWASVEANMRKLDPRLVKPRFTSIQGYSHDAYPWTVIRHLIDNHGNSTIAWCDPGPTPGFWEILRVMEFVLRGAEEIDSTPSAFIALLQERAGVTKDGVVGPKTWPAVVSAYEAKTRSKLVAISRD